MNSKVSGLILLLVLLAAAGGGIYYWTTLPKSPSQPEKPRPSPSFQSQAPAEPVPQYPVAQPSPAQAEAPAPGGDSKPKNALPELDESDEALQAALYKLLGKGRFESLLNPDGVVRRFVVTVDQATGKLPTPPDYSIFAPTDGVFRVMRDGEKIVVNPENSARYDAIISLLRAIDIDRLMAIYKRFYPLFQLAYRDLNPQRYFNDRLIEVIDHILRTPKETEPGALTLRNVSYKYQDPELETLSVGQKALLRVGPEHGKTVRTKLWLIRESLTRLKK